MKYSLVMVTCLSGFLLGYNSFHIQEAKNASNLGQEINISRCDFRGCGPLLRGVDFAGAQAGGVLFQPCSKASSTPGVICVPGQISDLTGVNFSNAELVGATFQGAILKGANFTGANIAYANFDKANLTNAKLDGAKNVGTATFCGATMPDGVVCKAGTWKSKSGKLFNCNCKQP